MDKVVQLVIDSSEGIIKSHWQCGGRFLESNFSISQGRGIGYFLAAIKKDATSG